MNRKNESSSSIDERTNPSSEKVLIAFLRTALVPTLLIKSLILFFGLQYTNYPGEGYGWGLVITICVSLVSFGLFIYKYAGEDEDAF